MKEIMLEDGLPAVMTEAGKETEELAPYQMILNGKLFTCQEDTEKDFEKYLGGIGGAEVEVTVFYKIQVHLPHDLRKGKGRKRLPRKLDGETKSKKFNCTIKTTKDHTWRIFKDKQMQFEELVKILASAIRETSHERANKF